MRFSTANADRFYAFLLFYLAFQGNHSFYASMRGLGNSNALFEAAGQSESTGAAKNSLHSVFKAVYILLPLSKWRLLAFPKVLTFGSTPSVGRIVELALSWGSQPQGVLRNQTAALIFDLKNFRYPMPNTLILTGTSGSSWHGVAMQLAPSQWDKNLADSNPVSSGLFQLLEPSPDLLRILASQPEINVAAFCEHPAAFLASAAKEKEAIIPDIALDWWCDSARRRGSR
jgi:hypothetical protein